MSNIQIAIENMSKALYSFREVVASEDIKKLDNLQVMLVHGEMQTMLKKLKIFAETIETKKKTI